MKKKARDNEEAEKNPGHAFPLLAFLALAWIGGFFYFAGQIEALAPSGSKADAIVVLTGGGNRINTGLDLLQAGQAHKMFISGVDSRVSQAKIISLWKDGQKRPTPCCLTLGHEARNTEQNALESAQWVQKEKIGSLHLVTSSYHMPRALFEFRNELPGVKIMPYPVPPTGTEFAAKGGFWPLVFVEYNKTLLAMARSALRPREKQKT